VARIRKLREAAEKEMNRFTSVADYDVRRIVGRKAKIEPTREVPVSTPATGRAKRKVDKSSSDQATIAFSPAPAEPGDEEDA
jgi:hypothetical protein